jgi:hypothetical protein
MREYRGYVDLEAFEQKDGVETEESGNIIELFEV